MSCIFSISFHQNNLYCYHCFVFIYGVVKFTHSPYKLYSNDIIFHNNKDGGTSGHLGHQGPKHLVLLLGHLDSLLFGLPSAVVVIVHRTPFCKLYNLGLMLTMQLSFMQTIQLLIFVYHTTLIILYIYEDIDIQEDSIGGSQSPVLAYFWLHLIFF